MSHHIDKEQALFLCALADDDAEKTAALAHAKECASCASLLEEGSRMLRVVDASFELPIVEPALESRVRSAVFAKEEPQPARARSFEQGLWALLALVSLGLIALDAKPNRPLEPGVGLHCFGYELGFAVLAFAITVGWMRLASRPLGALRGSVVAMAGALVGQTLLRTRCEAADAALHLLVFHGLGVLFASGLGALAATLLARATAR